MARIEKWGGLLTNASAYAIPPGGAIVQINLQNTVPGQLSCRGGMRRIAFGSGFSNTNDIRELWRYAYGNSNDEKLVVFDSAGTIQVVSAPQLGVETAPDIPCQSILPVFPGGANEPIGGSAGIPGAVTPPSTVQLGACCVGNVCVPGRTPEQCAAAGGVWLGPNTSCSESSCDVVDPPPGGGGGGTGWPCVIDGGDALTECCACSVIDGGDAWGCCG